MRKSLANFTLYDQTSWVDAWGKFGYEVEPEPRGLLVDEWGDTGDTVLSRARVAVNEIAAEGFEAILIGGPTDVVIQATVRSWELGLEVVAPAFSPDRTPDGEIRFDFVGVRSVPSPYELWVWKTRECEPSVSRR